MGRRKGVSERQLAELDDFETSSAFREVERLVIRYARRMTETPVEVSDELFAQLRSHFSERQLVELTSVIAWENYRARFNHALGLEAQGFSEGAYCALPVQSSMNGQRG
ncbi:MAG: carboxymuconolactone decarboxylase family protein [Bryobacterales bacterium]|nr:carboxymuconolactone decarboxylase family protein [Bryobacterales bacterium]